MLSVSRGSHCIAAWSVAELTGVMILMSAREVMRETKKGGVKLGHAKRLGEAIDAGTLECLDSC
eukprot:357627-Chlamydomonas_euryale.AAC.4